MGDHIPRTVWLTVNRACNMRCRWCYAGATGYRGDDEMSLELAERLTLLAKDAGARTILLIGGEPTLWKPLPAYNAFAREQGLTTVLVTNGARFADDRFYAEYAERPNDHIGLSLKGGTPEQLFRVAGVRNFDHVVAGVRRAIGELGAHVNLTYSALCEDELLDMARLVIDAGAKVVKLEFCTTTFADGKPSSAYQADPRELVSRIVAMYPELDRITGGRILLDMTLPLCLWPEDFVRELHAKGRLLSVCHVQKRRGLIFDPSGGVILCNTLMDYPMGRVDTDFADGPSLLAWLNGESMEARYRRVNRYPSRACGECEWRSQCAGGCPLRWATHKPDGLIRAVRTPLDQNGR